MKSNPGCGWLLAGVCDTPATTSSCQRLVPLYGYGYSVSSVVSCRIVRLVATLKGLGDILRLRSMLSDHLMGDAAANEPMEARGQLSIQPGHHCCQELAKGKAGSDGLGLLSPRFVRVKSLILAWKCLVGHLFGVQISAARLIKMWRFRRDGDSCPGCHRRRWSRLLRARLVELWCAGIRSGWSVSKDCWLPFLFLEDFFPQGRAPGALTSAGRPHSPPVENEPNVF